MATAVTSTGQLRSWCGPVDQISDDSKLKVWFKVEAPGYLAMLAFLTAYLLSVLRIGSLAQTVLNLAGAGVAAMYLTRKGATASVVSNLMWAAITLVGLVWRLAA